MAGSATAIVGAGLIGGAIAWRLSQSGAAVTLVDAGVFGGETSSAGAGMLSPGGEFEMPSRWLDLGVEGMRMYPVFVEELAAEAGMKIDFACVGSEHFVDADAARRRAQLQSSAGVRVEVTPEGLFYPDDAFVNPNDVLRALRVACEKHRVEILEQSGVEEVDASAFRAVVVAAGAWSSRIRVKYRGRALEMPEVEPVKGHLIGFDMEPGSLGAMLRRGHDYVLQRSSGFTIAGSTEERVGFDRSVDPGICRELHERAAGLWEPLRGRVVDVRWIGFRPYSVEGPHIGRVDGTNVWLAYGHFRNGILLTPLTADRIWKGIAG